MRSLLVVLLVVPVIAWAGFDEAVEAYRTGDYAAAMTQFKQLAEQGDAAAMYYVGHLYQHGYGVPANPAEAARWFRMGAARGDSLCQYYLGKFAERGEGMDKDLVAAHMWLSLSASHAPNARDAGYTRAEVRKLERKMTPEQIAKAKDLAARWKPEY
jgi:hypothetical protein